MKCIALIGSLVCLLPSLQLGAQEQIKQDLKKDPGMTLGAEIGELKELIQSGRIKRYSEAMFEQGVQLHDIGTVRADFTWRGANTVSSTLIGIHGPESHLIFEGTWRGDSGGAYPMLALTKGAKLTFSEKAHVDLVLEGSFFTRQIWAYGDGTGTIELAEGFVADRSKGAQVEDACGTIRLNGVNLISHHSQSLPYNVRPDGRGGIYHNGHVVIEGTTPSTWTIASNPQEYSAQIDFHYDGTIETQTPLTHNGQRRDTLAVGAGGVFMSTGAFRTCEENVTITKTGPAMLSLDGQQGYYPGSHIIVAEGLLRMHTDPAAGDHYDENAGNYLHLEVKNKGRAFLGAAVNRLAALTVEAGATFELGPQSTLEVSGPLQIAEGATVVGMERIQHITQ